MDIKKAINRALAEVAMSREELGNRSGINPNYISQIKAKGNTSTNNLNRLAKGFGIKTSELVKLGED